MEFTYDYPLGVKREVVSSIKPFFTKENYPDKELAGRINVSLDWPQTQTKYPSIFVTYTEGPIRNMGVGHVEYGFNDNYEGVEYKHYQFNGQFNFNVLALTPLERDRLAAGLVNLLAFDKTFLEGLNDADYTTLVVNTEVITPRGTNQTPVPWESQDEMIFSQTYSVPVHGEFYSNADTGELIQISAVQAWPYRPGEVPHFSP